MGRPETLLLTGAGGFVGSGLIPVLRKRGYRLCCALRGGNAQVAWAGEDVECFYVDDLTGETDWKPALQNIDGVVHLAARVHLSTKKPYDDLDAFRRVNVDGTIALARQAAEAGVRHFVYLSSIKVNGASTEPDRAFSEKDAPAPVDAYGLSKWEAEQALREVAAETHMAVTIIRPPLVYGPGVKANFQHLLKIIEMGIPLPFAGIANRRSFVALENLVDAIACCLEHPAARGETFLISDGEDLSIPELISRLAGCMQKPIRLFAFSEGLARTLTGIVGKKEIYNRLWGSLAVNSTRMRQVLGWTPAVSVNQGLKKTVDWYLNAGD